MTTIKPSTVMRIPRQELPTNWASVLGQRLHDQLSEQDCGLLQERIVGLGHGVQLAHLRSHQVEDPTLGAFMASGADDESENWLWMVVLIPAGDPSKHLGWMAHLAAGLHEESRRREVRTAADDAALLDAMREMLRPRTATVKKIPVPEETVAPTSSADFRMIIAILKEVEFVDHLLGLFVEHEVRGATVLEARGMAEHLSAHMSLFAGFKSAFKAVGHSQVIMTVVPTERTDEVLELVREAAGGMHTPGSGVAFALDVPAAIGFTKQESTDGR